MSMYDLVLGDGNQQTRGAHLLALVGDPEVGRFRDAWLEDVDGTLRVACYTRNGGGNRECWNDGDCGTCTGCIMAEVPDHPNYILDRDDEFDSTYATIYYRIDEPAQTELRTLLAEAGVTVQGEVDTDARWLAAIEAIKGMKP